MQSEDMNLMTEQTEEKETRFTPDIETLLRTCIGELGTPNEQREAQKKLADMISGPISSNRKL